MKKKITYILKKHFINKHNNNQKLIKTLKSNKTKL